MNSPSPTLTQGLSREHYLNAVLLGSCMVGLIAIVFYLFMPAPEAFKILIVVGYGVLVLITLLRTLPYQVRAGVFVLLLYFAGLGSLLDRGMTGAVILFLGFVAMVSLLFSSRVSIYAATAIAVLSILGFGRLSSSLAEWVREAGLFLVVATIIGVGLHRFQRELKQTQEAVHRMFETLQAERSMLEQRVEERTASATRKSEQLRVASFIARKIADVQDLNTLLNTAAELISEEFEFYHTGIFLLNETGDQAVLQASSSEGGRRMIATGYSSSAGAADLVGLVAAQKEPRIASDIGPNAVIFNNPDLPMTRSEIALPLIVRNKVLGVLDIQSDTPQAFGMADLDALETLADQIAIAIENARLIDDAQAAILQLEALTSSRTNEVWRQKLREKSRVFTYTPLGLRAEKISQNDDGTISAPVILRGQTIGTISIAKKGNAVWSKLDKALLEEVAGQVGLAVDNIRLLEEATQRARQEQAVGKLALRFSQSLDLDTLLQTAARELGLLPDVSEASVLLSQDNEHASRSMQPSHSRSAGENWKRLSEAGWLGSKGYRFDKIHVEPITELAELAVNAVKTGRTIKSNGSHIGSDKEFEVAVPIKLRGKTIGVVDLTLKDEYDTQTLSIVELAIERLASAMESARLYEEARLRADREQAISRVTAAIGASTEYEQILQTTIREIGNILGDTEVAIQILEEPAGNKRAERREQ